MVHSGYHTLKDHPLKDRAWIEGQNGRIISTRWRVGPVIINGFGICYMLNVWVYCPDTASRGGLHIIRTNNSPPCTGKK